MNPSQEKATPEWEYSHYRATLKRNGKFFAIMSQDSMHAIPEPMSGELISILNSHAELTASLDAAVKALEQADRWIVLAVARGDVTSADYACADCRPYSDSLIPGFKCAFHAAVERKEIPGNR